MSSRDSFTYSISLAYCTGAQTWTVCLPNRWDRWTLMSIFPTVPIQYFLGWDDWIHRKCCVAPHLVRQRQAPATTLSTGHSCKYELQGTNCTVGTDRLQQFDINLQWFKAGIHWHQQNRVGQITIDINKWINDWRFHLHDSKKTSESQSHDQHEKHMQRNKILFAIFSSDNLWVSLTLLPPSLCPVWAVSVSLCAWEMRRWCACMHPHICTILRKMLPCKWFMCAWVCVLNNFTMCAQVGSVHWRVEQTRVPCLSMRLWCPDIQLPNFAGNFVF